MAFTWEVEALRKLVEGIISDTASEYNKEAEEWGAVSKPEWADVVDELEFGDEFHKDMVTSSWAVFRVSFRSCQVQWAY